MPAQDSGFGKIECIYQKLPGWRTSTRRDYETREAAESGARVPDLLEKRVATRIGMVSTGPGREQTIFVDEFAAELAELTGTRPGLRHGKEI